MPVNIVNAGLLGAILFGAAALPLLAAWVGAVSLVAAARWLMARRCVQQDAAPPDWLVHVYVALSAVLGTLWGAAHFLLPAGGSVTGIAAVAFLVAGMCAGNAVAGAMLPRAVTAFNLPALGLAVIYHALQGGTYAVVMPVIIALFFFVLRRLSQTYGRTVTGALEANRSLEQARVRVETQARALKELARRHEAAARQAQAATDAKSSFLANISHEIRNPLNGMLGLVRSMLDGDLDPQVRTRLNTVRDSGAMLVRLLDDLLDFSRIEAGKMQLASSPFALADLTEPVKALWSPRAEEKGLVFTVDVAGDPETRLRGDITRIKQILFNFVSNAIKFTAKGEIRVSLAVTVQNDGQAQLRAEVRDTGIGVPKEAEGRLFQDFSQAEAGRRLEGSGLGLAISRRVAELMGGKVGFERRPGRGSLFWFEADLPLVDAGRAGSASVVGESQEPEQPAPAGGGEAETPVNQRPLRVLAAEDNPVNRAVLEGFLMSCGWPVDFVENGALAVEAASARAYDIILMDMRMPVMDGLAATRAIRELPTTAAMTPIVALTANARKEDEAQCLAAGMDGYVSKPIDSARLFAAIEKAVRAGRESAIRPSSRGAA
ncbi:MAG: response regulator [Maricaulaceae bacterium]|nr:response regulator [Maricaulaceae bacterium]